jgi:Flp pilus assembly protein TadD
VGLVAAPQLIVVEEGQVRMGAGRLVGRLLRALVFAVVGGVALRALIAPDALDARRAADQLLANGQYHAALRAYTALEAVAPSGPLSLRLGALRALRGEAQAAEDQLRRALRLGLRGSDVDLAYLYLGLQYAAQQRPDYADNAWAQLTPASPLYGVRHALLAERALAADDYALAEAHLQQAQAQPVPPVWRQLIAYRLALLTAARDAGRAASYLATLPVAPHEGADPLTRLLLPLAPSGLNHAIGELQAVLHAPPPEQHQLLGQFYLDAELYALADAQFARVPTQSAPARAAAAYAAYTRWQAGDRAGGLAQLQALAARYPDDTRAQSLLAVAYVGTQRPSDAAAQLYALQASQHGDPLVYLAWGQWYLSQGDYPHAALQYQRAVERAPAAERASYALAAAQFYLLSSYAVCDEGVAAAQRATDLAVASAAAWTTRAAITYHRTNPAAARDAAQRALALDPSSAMASYYLGVALAQLGQPDDARQALTRAADLAPASVWRERAEAELRNF